MNRVSLRTLYHGPAPNFYGKTGWAHRPANGMPEPWDFRADDGTETPCNAQDVTVWLGEAANAA